MGVKGDADTSMRDATLFLYAASILLCSAMHFLSFALPLPGGAIHWISFGWRDYATGTLCKSFSQQGYASPLLCRSMQFQGQAKQHYSGAVKDGGRGLSHQSLRLGPHPPQAVPLPRARGRQGAGKALCGAKATARDTMPKRWETGRLLCITEPYSAIPVLSAANPKRDRSTHILSFSIDCISLA